MTGPSKKTRHLCYGRDGHRCIVSNHPETLIDRCWGELTLQHRIGRGMGGSRRPEINQPSNLLTFCLHHNGLIESDADFQQVALRCGWSIPRNRRPAIRPVEVPVLYVSGWWLLDDKGGREPIVRAMALELLEVFGMLRKAGA